MRKIATIAAAAALISAPHAAVAADLGGGGSLKDVPPPVLITNWTGFYGAVGIGFGATVDTLTHNGYTTFEWTGEPVYYQRTHDFGGDGVLGTIQAGYDYQFPASRWLVGAFVDYDWENFEATHEESGVNGGFWNFNKKITLENQWSVGGRFGFLTTPDTLFYGLVAYSQASVKASVDGWRDLYGVPLYDLSGDSTLDGVTVGAGLETHLRDNWFLKLEYRFSQFSSDTAFDRYYNRRRFIEAVERGYADHHWAEVDADVHTARLSLVYKFSRQGVVEPLK